MADVIALAVSHHQAEGARTAAAGGRRGVVRVSLPSAPQGAGTIIVYRIKAQREEAGPNPHKDLAVKRKYFPRPRGYGVSLTPFLRGHSNGVEDATSATRLGYRKQTRLLAPKAKDEPHPTLIRTPAAPLRGARRLCRGTSPGRSRYSFVPDAVASRKTAGSSPPRERPVRQGSRPGRVVGRSLLLLGPRSGGGRVDVGMAPWRQARTPLRRPRADLVTSPDPPPGRGHNRRG